MNSPSQPWRSDRRAEVWGRRSNSSRAEIILTHNHGSSLATPLIHDRWPRLCVTPDCFYYSWTYSCMMSECNRTFGGFCCTFIPNNTSPDGSITRGPNSSLGRWLKTENPFGDTMTKWSGQWNGILTSPVMFPAVGAALLTLWACRSIPCIHEWLGRAEGKTWMQENLNGNLCTVPPYSSQWCRIIDLSVKSLVSLLQESNRLFSTPTKT